MSSYDVNQPKPNVHSLQINSSNSTSNCSLDQMHVNSDQSIIGRQENQNAAVYSAVEGVENMLGRSKYNIANENGQRRYGPPPDWKGEHPQRGCEVFIGKIPRDCFEDELIPVFERIGPIFMFRLMMEFTGTNRGYGFCAYTNRDDTIRAVEELNNYEIRRGKTIGVCLSVDNCRLFVGGIPKNKTREEIFSEMKKVTDGVQDVISYPSIADKTKNRGFAFVEYESHKAAAMARRKLIPGRIQLWGQQIAVDWAEPEREVNEDVMSKVKILYVRNLMLTTTEEKLRECFVASSQNDSQCIERVKKISDYAFIHFKEREIAQHCLETLNGTKIDGSTIEVSWAKPADKGDISRSQSSRINNQSMDFSINAELQSQGAHFMDPTSAFLTGANPGAPLYFPTFYGSGLENFICQSSGSSSIRNGALRTGRRNAAGGRSAAAQREKRHPLEKLQQHQSNPLLYWEVLENFCTRNGWEPPVYRAMPFEIQDCVSGGTTHIFMGQVTIPSLAMQYQTMRWYVTTDEAKEGAACTAIYFLQQMSVPVGLSEVNRSAATPVLPSNAVQNLQQTMGSPIQMLIAQSLQSQNQAFPPISGSVSYAAGLYGSSNNSMTASLSSMLPVNQNGSEVSFNPIHNLQIQNQLFNCQQRILANQIATPTIMSYAGMIPAGAYIVDANILNQSIGVIGNSVGSQSVFQNKNGGIGSVMSNLPRSMQTEYASNCDANTGITNLMQLDSTSSSTPIQTYMSILPQMTAVTAGQISSSCSFQNQSEIDILAGKPINNHSLGLENTGITPASISYNNTLQNSGSQLQV